MVCIRSRDYLIAKKTKPYIDIKHKITEVGNCLLNVDT